MTPIAALKIPLTEVLSSPAFRALDTARYARWPSPTVRSELGDGGQSMQGSNAARITWLRGRALQLPARGDTFIVTHSPNIAGAFPEWGEVAEGETVVVGRTISGVGIVGRIRIDEWPRLR